MTNYGPAGRPEDVPAQVCVRHPDRPTGLRCTRCGRPACPDCLRDAAVGAHCVDCVAASTRQQQRAGRTVAGAPPAGRAVVVPTLIALNALVYAITVVQAGSLQQNFTSALFDQWQLWPPLVAQGEIWRLLTAGFLHIGLIHFAVNMLALWILGRDAELVLGRWRFVSVYVLSLLGGSVAVFLLGNLQTSVAGASGAIWGLMGSLLVLLLRLRRSPGPALFIIGANVIITLTIPGISLLGHLGGLVWGTAATAIIVLAPRSNRTTVQVIGVVGLTVIALGLIALRYLQLS